MSTYYFHHIHCLSPFPYALPPPTGTKPLTGIILFSCLSCLHFLKERYFCTIFILLCPFPTSSYVHIYANRDMIPVETITGMGEGRLKENGG
jgi:hypothetical protein